jgi:hypothetical protein
MGPFRLRAMVCSRSRGLRDCRHRAHPAGAITEMRAAQVTFATISNWICISILIFVHTIAGEVPQ